MGLTGGYGSEWAGSSEQSQAEETGEGGANSATGGDNGTQVSVAEGSTWKGVPGFGYKA